MKIKSTREVYIGHWLVCAIENCDTSGLSEQDLEVYNEACDDIGTDTLNVLEDSKEFRRCTYSNLFDDCYTVELVKFESEG
jgi:hypothetical protein